MQTDTVENKIIQTFVYPSIKEEIANSITHSLGVLLSVFGLILLVSKSVTIGTRWHIVCSSIYGSSLLLLYLISTLYHSITHIKVKNVFRRLDHISIYLLIFGTYMPLTLIALNGTLGWVLFGIQCACCVGGTIVKAVFGPRYAVVSALFYLLMGWMAIFVIKPIYNALSFEGIFWILLGGVFYTLGVLFFANDRKVPYFHAIWHIFVILGSICHFLSILWYIIPITL